MIDKNQAKEIVLEFMYKGSPNAKKGYYRVSKIEDVEIGWLVFIDRPFEPMYGVILGGRHFLLVDKEDGVMYEQHGWVPRSLANDDIQDFKDFKSGEDYLFPWRVVE